MPAPESSASIMQAVLARLGGTERAQEHKVFECWTRVIGSRLAGRTRPEALRGKMLIVRVNSSALGHELVLMRAQILEQMSRDIGEGVVTELRTRVGPL